MEKAELIDIASVGVTKTEATLLYDGGDYGAYGNIKGAIFGLDVGGCFRVAVIVNAQEMNALWHAMLFN